MENMEYMSKKTICFVLPVLLILSVFSGASMKAEKTMVLHYSFGEPHIQNLGDECRVEIEGCTLHEYNGLMLPVKQAHILIPYGTDVEKIEVHGSRELLGWYTLEKVKPLIVGREKIELASSDTVDKLYEKVGTYGLRGYNILVVNILPVSYQKGKVWYCREMEVKLTLRDGSANPLYRGMEKDREWVTKYIDNPWVLDTYPPTHHGDEHEYLIITSEELQGAFEYFAEYKESRGTSVEIFTIDEIKINPIFWGDTPLFNDTQAQIRNCIRYAYTSWGTDYVLLAGDGDVQNASSNIIPPRYLYATSVGLPLATQGKLEAFIPSDVYYACLDGTFNEDMDERWGENATENNVSDNDEADLYAEVWVGRACIDSIEEAYHFINKTMAYEADTDDEHLMQVLLLGEYLGFGGPAEWGGNHKDKAKQLIPSMFNITTLYDRERTWSKSELLQLLNRGVNIVNHDGHGWTNYALKMHNSDLRGLHNTEYFFLYSQTCLAGSFDNWYPTDKYYDDDCFAEHLTVDEYGAVACIMNSRYGLGRENSTDSPGQRYDLSFFRALFEEHIKELGRASHYSKEDNVWRINENGMRWTYYQTNLFGDPQLAVREPAEVITVNATLVKPANGLYIFDKGPIAPFMNRTVILGKITVQVEVETSPPGRMEKVSFYVDNELKATVTEEPYEWQWNENALGTYRISAEACAVNGKCEWVEKEVFIINL